MLCCCFCVSLLYAKRASTERRSTMNNHRHTITSTNNKSCGHIRRQRMYNLAIRRHNRHSQRISLQFLLRKASLFKPASTDVNHNHSLPLVPHNNSSSHLLSFRLSQRRAVHHNTISNVNFLSLQS
ncbi:hypothetical protein BLNAU_16230 [Blattamonas nauphoetae]|uniref:Secreted protein n=1 Tax=Blattamonas nauphoetae TaxID=2049346 RepID=A0ABQ9XC73_9EUKA|nr:hypothetical protein BLNAU_16230 [Blattamonas nauphoetae]